jgi:hypothetical protein
MPIPKHVSSPAFIHHPTYTPPPPPHNIPRQDVDDLLTPLRRFGRNTWNSFLTGTHTSLAEGLAGRPVTDIMQSRLTATKAYVAAGVPSESPIDRIQSIAREIGNLNNATATADDKE